MSEKEKRLRKQRDTIKEYFGDSAADLINVPSSQSTQDTE